MADTKQGSQEADQASACGDSEASSLQARENGKRRHSDCRSPNRPLVVIVGCGFAGLAAARALHENSCFQVVVLESRDRIGGRVYTDYSFGFPVDLGAAWLHGVGSDNPLASRISQLHLPLYRTSEEDSVLYDHDLESYALYEEGGAKVPQPLVEEVETLFEETLEETRKLRSEYPHDMTMEEALEVVYARRPELRLSGRSHDVLQWYICRMEGWFACDLHELSFRNWEEEIHLPGGHGLMLRGYLPVLRSLAQGLDIRLNHKVVSIDRTNPSSITLRTSNGEEFLAHAAIVTVPLGVLQSPLPSNSLSFLPPLPDWKTNAIQDIGVGNENKILLFFGNVFWPNVEFLGLVAQSPYDCGYFLNLHKASGHPVLIFMPSGSLANDLQAFADEQAVEFAMEQLRKMLPHATDPLRFLVTRWGTDPHSRGCYSYDRVGVPADVYDRLRAPLRPLFFAGEATSRKYPGTVHGAYETGVEAAREAQAMLAGNENCSCSGGSGQGDTSVAGRVSEVPALIPLRISRL